MGAAMAFKMAIRSIVSSKMRSFLTMLGIIIGILSVIILVSIGQGTKQQISSQIQNLGTNLISINITGNRNKGLTNTEIESLKKMPGIKDIAPVITSNVTAKAGDKSMSTNLEGDVPNYETIRNTHVQAGRFILPVDVDNRFKVAVIGINVADQVFQTRNVVGKTFSINGVTFKVVGLLQEMGSSIGGSNDDKIIIPISTAQRLIKNTNIRTYYVEAQSPDTVDQAVGYLQLYFAKKYNNDTNAYRIFNQTDLLSTVSSTTQSMTVLLGGIAAISLVVGGIGIMNIMLVSVTERTREIGIRKAIGAKRRSILTQFLIEAVVISGIGGVIGVLLGFLGSSLLGRFGVPATISLSVVLLSVAFSVSVGIIFGLYPANKASKLSPIEALRYE